MTGVYPVFNTGLVILHASSIKGAIIMNHQPFISLRLNKSSRHIITLLGALFLLILLFSNSAKARTEAVGFSSIMDTPELIVNNQVEDFVLLNGHIFWTYCTGDLFNYTTYIKTQPINDPSCIQSLATLNGTKCVGISEMQADPVFRFYKNNSLGVIEKRAYQNFNSPSTLYNYSKVAVPNALALADDFIYWAKRDNAIKRISIYGGSVTTVATTDNEPVYISIDGANIWYGTSTGVYRMPRNSILKNIAMAM
jgi:hypothetical protein